jgi:hypothetical protein
MMPDAPSRVDRALLALIVVAIAWMFQIHLRLTHVDYNTFHVAGTAVLSGDWEGLYSSDRSSMGGFLYPLGAGAFFSGFAALGETTGRLAFYLLLAACIVWALRWCSEMWSGGRLDPRVLWITLVLGSRSINDSWISGNVSLLLLALALVSHRRYFRSQSQLQRHGSALALALATSFKVFPAVLGAYWFWRRDFRQVLRIVAWTCALYLIPYAIFAILKGSLSPAVDLFLSWVRALRDPSNFGSYEMIHFQNLSAAFHRVSSTFGWSRGWVTNALALIAFALAVVPALKRHAQDPQSLARDYAVILAWVPLLSPVTWHHLGVFYLPLVYVTARDARNEGRLARSIPLWAFLILYTLTGKNVIGTHLHAWVSDHSIPLLGILALVLPATRRVFRSAT